MTAADDEIDLGMQTYVSQHPGSCIAHVIAEFLPIRSESVLRQRIRSLSLRKKLRLQKTRKEVLVFPGEEAVEAGIDA